jgi:hypothetical protein
MIIRRAQVLKAVDEITKPMELVNNTENWKLENETLIPRRFMLLLKTSDGTEELAVSSCSVTLELSENGTWRIYQVGAPKLSRAMSLHGTPETNFLVWLPDLNRHYLGQMKVEDEFRNPKIELTALFDDRLIRANNNPKQIRRAGEKFDASSKDFFKRMRDLSQDLDLPKKMRRTKDDAPGGQLLFPAR